MRFRVVTAAWVIASLAVLLAGFAGGAGAPAAPAKPPAPAVSGVRSRAIHRRRRRTADTELGKKAAAEVEKEMKVIDSYSTEELVRIVTRLRPYTEKPHQQYTLKVVDENGVNAFSLPGGYIFFTKGLLKAVESEDELAGVTGHEMGHICLNHARQEMGKDSKYLKVLAAFDLAAVMARSSGADPGAVAAVGMMVKTGTLNQWGEQCEYQADAASVRYLYASKVYNPVPMLTVTEGWRAMEDSGPKVDMGIYQDDPYGKDRVVAVRKLLDELHVPIERAGGQGIVASADGIEKNGKEVGEIRLNDVGSSNPRRRRRAFRRWPPSGVRICSIPCCCGNSNQWTSPRHSRTKAPCSCKPKAKPCSRSCPGTRRSTRRRWTNYPSRP